MNKSLQILFGGLMLFLASWAHAQPKINSPYSRFGIGEIRDQNFVALSSMGGLAASYHNIYNVNALNPASLGFLRNTAFEVGVYGKNSWLKTDNANGLILCNAVKCTSLAFTCQQILKLSPCLTGKKLPVKSDQMLPLFCFSLQR